MKTFANAVFFLMLMVAAARGQTAFTVTGVTDKATYSDTVTISVTVEGGYTYALYLNGTNVSAGGAYTIRNPDFYLVQAFRTNNTSGEITNRYFRIIVDDSTRLGTEHGLPSHTPLIAIPSSSDELTGGNLRLIAPAAFPTGYEIPVVAWVVNDEGKALRANGWLQAEGHPSIFLRRGVGSGFLGSNNAAGALNYSPHVKGIPTNKTIQLESATTWTQVSGLLGGNVSWPQDSRIFVSGSVIIPAGSTLTIGSGTIVRLNPGVNITNSGSVTINGTIDRPVIFMPNSRSQYWGGFVMRGAANQITANATIFSGPGAAPNYFSGGHKFEQPLFDGGAAITLTDCAQIYSGGQFGRDGGIITLTRFLVQRVTSAGQFTGASFRVNDSAFIEVPDDSSNFVDADNDALYLDDGNHGFTNTLFGWTKDDAVDSGGNDVGTIYYESCWFESVFHEGNALSGAKNVYPHNCVYMDCGQGHESGYSASGAGPNGWVDQCLFVANKSGLRHGDNYNNMSGGYKGLLTASNSILLFNHRDIFGYNWQNGGGWTNASGQMNIRNNWLTKPDTNFPNNTVWNPASDGWRLAPFSTAPGDADVGVGLALRLPTITLQQLTNAVPVRLSTFSTNFVSVDYAIETPSATLASGTLEFVPGEIVKNVRITAADTLGQTIIRVRLANPVHAEITAQPFAFYRTSFPPPRRIEIRSFGGDWYLFWSDPASSLQQAPTVTGPWTTLPDPSPVQVDFSAAMRFYRLIK